MQQKSESFRVCKMDEMSNNELVCSIGVFEL